MLRILLIVALLLPSAANANRRRFHCPELKGLARHSLAYRDTLDACKWDFANPSRNVIVH